MSLGVGVGRALGSRQRPAIEAYPAASIVDAMDGGVWNPESDGSGGAPATPSNGPFVVHGDGWLRLAAPGTRVIQPEE